MDQTVTEGEENRSGDVVPAGAQADGLDDLAAILAEQLSACHAAAARYFAIAQDEEDFEFDARVDALKLATRLVQASASAAAAVKRIKGGEFHHHVTVSRIDYAAEKAARKEREAKEAKEKPGEAKKKLREQVSKIIEMEMPKFTPEEQKKLDAIWAQARERKDRAERWSGNANDAPDGEAA